MFVKVASIIIVIGMFGQPALVAQVKPSHYEEILKKNYSGWNVVTKKMLTGPSYKDYPDATGELVLDDQSRIILLSKPSGDRIKYSVVRVDATNQSKLLFQDSWPDGNPTPFLAPNRNASPKDIKAKKVRSVDLKASFVFDEWAYRWVIAKINNKWEKILIQSEE